MVRNPEAYRGFRAECCKRAVASWWATSETHLEMPPSPPFLPCMRDSFTACRRERGEHST